MTTKPCKHCQRIKAHLRKHNHRVAVRCKRGHLVDNTPREHVNPGFAQVSQRELYG